MRVIQQVPDGVQCAEVSIPCLPLQAWPVRGGHVDRVLQSGAA